MYKRLLYEKEVYSLNNELGSSDSIGTSEQALYDSTATIISMTKTLCYIFGMTTNTATVSAHSINQIYCKSKMIFVLLN